MKKSIHTDALETLGITIDEHEKRDAIHLAIEPVIVGEILYPGQNIGLRDGKEASIPDDLKYLGIVDPFNKV